MFLVDVDDKPPLQAVYLVHAGVKGMKWGVRKAEDRRGIFKQTRTNIGIARKATPARRKVGIGLIAVAATIAAGRVAPLPASHTIAIGAATAAVLMAREGRRAVRTQGS